MEPLGFESVVSCNIIPKYQSGPILFHIMNIQDIVTVIMVTYLLIHWIPMEIHVTRNIIIESG